MDANNAAAAETWLRELIGQYEKELLRICVLYLREWTLAEDAVQETFLKAYRNRDSFRGDSGEKTWLMRIAINTCKDVRRSAWHRYIDRRVDVDTLRLTAPAPSEHQAAITEAVMQLSPKYLEVVLLYFYQGYTMRETAAILGVSEAAVSQRLSKAKKKLRFALEGDECNENRS